MACCRAPARQVRGIGGPNLRCCTCHPRLVKGKTADALKDTAPKNVPPSPSCFVGLIAQVSAYTPVIGILCERISLYIVSFPACTSNKTRRGP